MLLTTFIRIPWIVVKALLNILIDGIDVWMLFRKR